MQQMRVDGELFKLAGLHGNSSYNNNNNISNNNNTNSKRNLRTQSQEKFAAFNIK
jgi:hypothetical protein